MKPDKGFLSSVPRRLALGNIREVVWGFPLPDEWTDYRYEKALANDPLLHRSENAAEDVLDMRTAARDIWPGIRTGWNLVEYEGGAITDMMPFLGFGSREPPSEIHEKLQAKMAEFDMHEAPSYFLKRC